MGRGYSAFWPKFGGIATRFEMATGISDTLIIRPFIYSALNAVLKVYAKPEIFLSIQGELFGERQ